MKSRLLGECTYDEVAQAIAANMLVIVPTGATEAHGPHLPTDTDSHQATEMAKRLAERIDAVVAPTLEYGVSKTFEHFPGTISLSIPVYQEVVYEVGAALVKQGFRRILLLNGNRPNGTSNDAVSRRLIDDLDTEYDFQITNVSYWEPAMEQIDALRKSPRGGMGHGGEFETSLQLCMRPHLVEMQRLEGVTMPLVGWDLVETGVTARTYGRRPTLETNHASIFGDPRSASAESGRDFIDAVVDGLASMMSAVQVGYRDRK